MREAETTVQLDCYRSVYRVLTDVTKITGGVINV